MKIAICDDESPFRKILINSLNKYSSEYGMTFIYFEYDDGTKMLADNLFYDLIFMDFQMDKKNGIDVIDILRKRNDDTAVIFISSYKEVVFDSLKVRTHRFLVKPLDEKKLYEALNSYISMRNTENVLLLKNDDLDQIERISEKSILYAEADGFYCKIRTYENTYTYKKTLSHLYEELKSDFFFRSHRSFIVNFKYITRYSQSEIILENNEKALLTKSKYFNFQKTYMGFLKRNNSGTI